MGDVEVGARFAIPAVDGLECSLKRFRRVVASQLAVGLVPLRLELASLSVAPLVLAIREILS